MQVSNFLNPDELAKKLYKRQYYLICRFVALTLILYFSYLPILSGNIELDFLLKTTLLFIIPISLEYLLGMDTYNPITNISRLFGIILSGVVLFFCLICFFSSPDIKNVKGEYFLEFKSKSFQLESLMNFFWYIPILSFIDFTFTFNKSEMEFYNRQNLLEKALKNYLKKPVLKEVEKNLEEKFNDIIEKGGGKA